MPSEATFWQRCRRFIILWMRFAFKDAAAGAFGWGAIPGAAIIVAAFRMWGVKMPSDPTSSEVLVSALAAAGRHGL